jgi:hypothetical protein
MPLHKASRGWFSWQLPLWDSKRILDGGLSARTHYGAVRARSVAVEWAESRKADR